MEVMEENRVFTVTTTDGEVRKIAGKVITTKDGFDTEGNPKISVEIKVPPMEMGVVPGKVA